MDYDMQTRPHKVTILYNSPVILTFALISFGVLLLHNLTMGRSTMLLFSVYRSSMLSPFFYIRLFGHVLGHAGWQHYINNMTMLLLVGPMLEEKYGSKTMLSLIALTAALTGVTNILLFPRTALLGASGIVFMMITLSSITSVKKGQIPLTLILIVFLYLGEQVVAGVFSTDNISHFTHILGGILGILYGMLLSREK